MTLNGFDEREAVAFDCNVIVSAILFPDSEPGRALAKAREAGRLVFSDAAIAEILDVLGRSKFDRYLSSERRLNLFRELLREADLIPVVEEVIACRDPNDDKWLSLAVSAAASFLVTGDGDLLVLRFFRSTRILTAAAFLQL